MVRLASLSIPLLVMVLFIASPASIRGCERDFEAEWLTISANNTRGVYNVGIGSLMSWASIQFGNKDNKPITSVTKTTVSGIKRELVGCWRYQSMSAFQCEDQDYFDGSCPPMAVAYFEVKEAGWKALRTRECSYDVLVNATVDDKNAPEGYYFTWGNPKDQECDTDGGVYEAVISQSYWDFIIGGIFSWDGQLTGSGFYTWDWTAEKEIGEEEIKGLVAKAPSYTYQERYDFALEFIRSTGSSSDIMWIDDRRCPFTCNAPMTIVRMLAYDEEAYSGTDPLAIGSVSPLVSQHFYDLVDELLIEGGWAYSGANNTIDNRPDYCDRAYDDFGITRGNCDPNPYYNDLVEWRESVGFVPGEVFVSSDESSTTTSLSDESG